MVRKFFPIFVIIFCLSIELSAQNISARASTDTTDYVVGDYIHYNIKVDHDKNVKLFKPVISDSLKNLTLIKEDSTSETTNGNRVTTTYKYVLSGYDSAGVVIPQIPIAYQAQGDTAVQTVLTNPVILTIRTVPVDIQKDIKDVKAPITIPPDWGEILLWIFIILLVLAILYYFYRRYKKNKIGTLPERVTVKLPPHRIALNSLHTLEEEKLWQKGEVKEYHSRITEVIRRYFEERFNLPALELTTSEAVDQLKLRKETEPIREITYDFLSNADMVKFAKFMPLTSVNEEMLRQAYEIVNKTIPSSFMQTNENEEVKDVQ
jgi:hypothetical protein